MSGHVHFVQSLEPLEGGGLGAAALQLHRELRAQGGASTLVSTRGPQRRPTGGAEEFVRRGPTRLFFAPGLRRRARELAASAAVFHAHGFYVYPNAVFGGAARRAGRPLVCHPHGMFEPWILQRSIRKKQLAGWLFEDANFRAARLWRALTSAEADQIRGLGIRAEIVVIPNGIDLAEFSARPAAKEPPRTVLFLGRLHPKKGLDLLLQAWARWHSRVPDWSLVLAGPDEGGYRTELERMIAAENLPRVHLPGTVSGTQRLDLLAAAGIFALPSRSEGFPMAVLEAMARAVPVLASHECHFPEIASAGAGWLCGADAESVTRALGEALEVDEAERTQRGLAGRALVERRFQWGDLARDLHAACEKL